MEKHAFYRCGCGQLLYSSFPYKVLYCRCGNIVPRLFMVHSVPSLEETGANNAMDYKHFLHNMKLIGPVRHPYVDQERSFRPYVLGMGCDGTTDLNIHYVAQKVLFFLGFKDYRHYHDLAYPNEDNSFADTDFSACRDEAVGGKLVVDMTLVPENATIGTLVQELEAVNFRSLANVLEDLFDVHNIDTGAKLCDLLEVYRGIHKN